MRQDHGPSVRRAYSALKLSRSVYAYQPRPRDDGPIIDLLTSLVDKYPRCGFATLFQLVRRKGHTWNHKRAYRVYCALRLNLRRKEKKRLPSRNPQPLAVPEQANICWSADFESDALYDGRRFRTSNVVDDDFNREVLGIEIDLNLPAFRTIRVLDRIAARRGYPQRSRLENGPELVSVAMADWAELHGIVFDFIQPGKPVQNDNVRYFYR